MLAQKIKDAGGDAHIFVEDFRLDDPGTSAKVYADNKSETYDVYFQEFEEFTLAYAVIS